jgi:hypothetical protein
LSLEGTILSAVTPLGQLQVSRLNRFVKKKKSIDEVVPEFYENISTKEG